MHSYHRSPSELCVNLAIVNGASPWTIATKSPWSSRLPRVAGWTTPLLGMIRIFGWPVNIPIPDGKKSSIHLVHPDIWVIFQVWMLTLQPSTFKCPHSLFPPAFSIRCLRNKGRSPSDGRRFFWHTSHWSAQSCHLGCAWAGRWGPCNYGYVAALLSGTAPPGITSNRCHTIDGHLL